MIIKSHFLTKFRDKKLNSDLRFAGNKRRGWPDLGHDLPPISMEVWVMDFFIVVQPHSYPRLCLRYKRRRTAQMPGRNDVLPEYWVENWAVRPSPFGPRAERKGRGPNTGLFGPAHSAHAPKEKIGAELVGPKPKWAETSWNRRREPARLAGDFRLTFPCTWKIDASKIAAHQISWKRTL